MSKFIVFYDSTWCIGYSADFKTSYFRCNVQYNNGTTGTIVEARTDGSYPVKMGEFFVPAIASPTPYPEMEAAE